MSLKVVRRPKSPYFYIRGTIAGVRIEESTGTDRRGLAEEYRAKREAEIYRAQLYGGRTEKTFADAVVSYVEARDGNVPRFLDKVFSYFDRTPLCKIDLEAIVTGAAKTYPKASAPTRNRQFFTPTVAVLKHAATLGWCNVPIIARPKASEGVVRWLTHDEADRLISACAPHLRALVIFLLYTGARAGEALWLDWHDVDLDRAHVAFVRTKTKYPRGVPLHERVVAALANLKHRDGAVFRRPDGKPYAPVKGKEDTSAGTRFATGFKAACRRAGIADFRVHDCRHTWATWHYQQNRDLTALMHLGGWRSEKMVLRYAHQNVEEFASSISRIPGGKLGELVGNKGKSA